MQMIIGKRNMLETDQMIDRWRLTPIIKGTFTVSVKHEIYSKTLCKNHMIQITKNGQLKMS